MDIMSAYVKGKKGDEYMKLLRRLVMVSAAEVSAAE